MINKELRAKIADSNESALLFDNPSYGNAIIGISQDDRVVYDYNKMVEELAKEDECSFEEAIDFIEI